MYVLLVSQKYGINHVKIEYLFLQNNHSDSNFNQKFDYNYGMQGLALDTSHMEI